MSDNLSPENRRRTMRAVKSKNTYLERALFGMLAGMRLRGWKKNVSSIRGKPDVVFEIERVAVFVDGCFWHGCPYCRRPMPATNRDYWERKIGRNVERDKRVQGELESIGWKVIRIWEHEMRTPSMRKAVGYQVKRALDVSLRTDK